jgi:CDP-glycerol glycerophosphotransferase (TagB/SpsB family)
LQNFTKRQTKGKLPKLSANKKLISCFLSSFDELILAGYSSKDSNLNQNNALRSISEEVAKRSNWQLVIRCHPNMLTRPQSEQDYWRGLLKSINALVVLPHEDIDTYSLIEKSDLVLTFGSTVAVEALALNIPSLVIGRSLYHGHDLVRTVSNFSELQRYLDNVPRIDEKQLSELEIYAYFQLYGGIRFRNLSVKNSEVYEFNPPLFWNKTEVLGSEKLLSVLTKLYSRIQDSKKVSKFWTSKGLLKKG